MADQKPAQMPEFIDIVFDKLPGHEAAKFVEVENSQRQSIRFGEWIERDDGYAVLRITRPPVDRERVREAFQPEIYNEGLDVLEFQLRDETVIHHRIDTWVHELKNTKGETVGVSIASPIKFIEHYRALLQREAGE